MKHYFNLTCKSVQHIDSFTEFDKDGEVIKSSIPESIKSALNKKLCPQIESYADKLKFVEDIGYLNDYKSAESKKILCAISDFAFTGRDLKMINEFCKENN